MFHNFLNKEDIQWLMFFREEKLNDNQKLALVFIREVGAIDNNSYRQLTGVNRAEAGFDLRDLRKKDLIEQRFAGKSTYYLPSLVFKTSMVDKEHTMVDKGIFIEGMNEMPRHILQMINNIGKRSQNVELMRETIVELCKWKDFSIAELAIILGRNEKYIKTNYIQPLIEAKKIIYTIPAMITHPNQKYRTIRETSDFI